MRWHLVTPEYPPKAGGVGDYTALLARALENAGDTVDVWVGGPPLTSSATHPRVHLLPDRFERGSEEVLDAAWRENPATILIQYVPSVFGRHGANLAFCRWLASQRSHGRDIRVMFHEPYFYFSWRRPWRNALAVAQRAMARLMLRAATRVYYSSENWHRYLGPYGAPKEANVMPIPSTIPANPLPSRTEAHRARFGGSLVVGHFGTFGQHITDVLSPTVEGLLEADPSVRVALIGANSGLCRERLARRRPAAVDRIVATGSLDAIDVAAALRACDLVYQPYPDGVTTRRTSIMAALHNECATVTTGGALTEPVWRESQAVALTPAGDSASAVRTVLGLLSDPAERRRLAVRGSRLYRERFAIDVTVRLLRDEAGAGAR